MYFTHDPDANFYYCGEEPATATTYKQLLVDSKPGIIGIDVETISLKERVPIGISIALSPTCAYYFQLFPTESPAVPWHLLKDPTITKVGHNLIFDLAAMREYEIDGTNIIDTNVMARLLCYKFTGLLDMSFIHQMEVHDVKEYIPKGGTMLDVDQAVVASKCMQDSSAAMKLNQLLIGSVDKDYLFTEMQLIPILVDMSYRGILIDQEARQEVEDELTYWSEYYLSMCEEVGFNPGSPQQVAYILAKRNAYSIFHKLPFTRGSRRRSLSTAVEVLEKMDDPLASIVLKYRKYTKLNSTYIKPWSHDERAYTRYHLEAATGRPSSTDRNMQNIPGKRSDIVNCRNILLPDSGTWTDMDWSQLELRVLAFLSQDKEMLHIYSLPQKLPDGSPNPKADIHQATAEFLNIDRAFAKNVNFALIYGATDETIMETAHIRSLDRARQLRESIFQLFTGAGDWIETQHYNCLKTFRARTIFGRDLRLPTDEEERVDGIQRKAVNYPIQGSAAEILKRGLILMKDLPLSLQVHDELLVDGFIPDYRFKPLESIAPFHTPVEIRYLDRWE